MDERALDELAAWLDTVPDSYRVERTLATGPDEVTQLVWRRGHDSQPDTGPFVRKIFRDDGRGAVYEELLAAQRDGIRLVHTPLVHECVRSQGMLEVVMEYVPGPTLEEYVRREGPGTSMVAFVGPQLCDALTELHESLARPLVHRDVKPSNIMVYGQWLMLVDLGIARMFREGSQRDTACYGTPEYAPPEQFGFGQTSPRSDVYAAGMTLAFCLTGEQSPASLRECRFQDPRVPAALQLVLVRATEFDPERRYVSARALKTALEVALQDATVPSAADGEAADPVSDGGRFWEKQRVSATVRSVTEAVGRVWNTLVVVVWGALCVTLVTGIPNPTEDLVNSTVWQRVAVYVCAFLIPFSAIGYLLLDKRRLRSWKPISQLSWRQEVPTCIGICFFSFIVGVIAYNLFGG